jgi:pimeloyl-[acyl-carrier protein] synthase
VTKGASITTRRVPLFSHEMAQDPYPVYHQLRAADPVHWSDTFNAWILTRYDDVAAGLNDLRLSSDRIALMKELAGSDELEPFFAFLSRRMIFADPPNHTRLRGLVSKTFTPHVVEAMRPHIQKLVDGFLDAVANRGQMDVIHDFAFPLPATVIAELLGVPPEDREQLKKWSDDFVVFFGTHPGQVSLDQYRQSMRSMREMSNYFRAAATRDRSGALDCLLKTMALAEEQGDKLSEGELVANANLLLVAGHETTTNLIGNGVLALLRHPDQMQKLRDNPALIPGAIEEFLRYDGPVQFTHRVASEDLTLGGKAIRRGQFVFLFLAAANRDPAHFPDPDRLDVTRAPHKHLAFGLGHHFCLGAPLARLEAQIAFATILRRFQELRLAAEHWEYNDNFNLHGLKALPVTFKATGR